MRVFYSLFVLFLFFAPAMQAQVCMGFDNFDGNYGANNPTQFGQEFYSLNGLTLSSTGFVDANGNVTNTAHFFAGTFLYSGLFTAASGVFVKTNTEANLIISTGPASEVSFDYIDRNSLMNFSVNGEPITVIDNLIDLPAAIAPGVTLSISESSIGSSFIGTATLTGYITEVIVGGDDMGIDDICFVETAAICQISGPTVSASTCDVSGEFSAEINFSFSEVGASGFNVTSNSVTYGPYPYASLPITIDGLAGDNSTNYTFLIEDIDNPNCVNEVVLGTVDCPVCNFSNLVATPTNCVTDTYYNIDVSFDYQNNTSGFFDIYLDGEFLEFWTYGELPITMELQATSLDPILLTFCDQGGMTCCESVTVQPLNCGAFDCAISNLQVDPAPCNNDGTFGASLFFEHENEGTSFTVTGQGGLPYGTYFYAELPIFIDGLVGDGVTAYDFVVTDSNDSLCTETAVIAPQSCVLPCGITNVSANPLQCTSSTTFSMTLDFDHENTGSVFSVYTTGGAFIGNYNYSSLPLTITNVPVSTGQTTETFSICDQANPNCCNSLTIDTPDCTPPPCELANFIVTSSGCDTNGDFGIILNADQANAGTQFSMYVNGAPAGTYLYADLPLSLPSYLEGDGTTTNTFLIQDFGNLNCSATYTLQPVTCAPPPCDLSPLQLAASVCDDSTGTFYVTLDFGYSNTSSMFNVAGNGNSYGNFSYNDLPITIGPLVGDGVTVYDFLVTDSESPNCVTDGELPVMDCTTISACDLVNLGVESLGCSSDSTYAIFIDFDAVNEGANGFNLTIGGQPFGAFNYAALPLTLDLPAQSPGLLQSVFICDNDNSDCCIESFYMEPDCTPIPTCDLGVLIATPTACDDSTGTFNIVIDFTHSNASSMFSLTGDGTNYGNFNYASLPIIIGPFLGDGVTSYNFLATDLASSNCVTEGESPAVLCNTETCGISNIVVDPGQCTSDSTYSIFIDFDVVSPGSNGFDVSTGGINIGNFSYADLPLTLNNFPSSTGSMQNVFICDIDNPDCCQELSFMGLNCTPNPVCELSPLQLTASPCNDSTGNFFVMLDFDFANTATTFTVAGNGIMYGTFNYVDLPITLGPLPGDGITNYEFTVTDSDSPNCVSFEELGTVNCTGTCELFTPVADPIQCTSDSTFSLFVDFDFANVSGSTFNLFADGQMFGNFNYSDLPLDINDFPTSGVQMVTLMVCDATDPNCCATTTFESLDCAEDCNIFEVTAEAFSCDQGLFLVELDVEYQNPGSLGFQVFGNGTNYGNYSYSDLPITIGALEGDGVSVYEFVVADLTNASCSNFTTVEAVNCLDECVFDEVVATPLNCEADGEFMVLLTFSANNVGAEGYSVYGNGVDYGVFDYDTDALVGPFPGDGETMHEFILTDMMNQDCVGGVEVQAPLCTTSSINDAFNGAVAIRYNFVGEQIVIDMETPFAETSEVLIYDAMGRLRHTVALAAGMTNETIDVSHLGTGLFICQLRNSEGSVSESFVNAK